MEIADCCSDLQSPISNLQSPILTARYDIEANDPQSTQFEQLLNLSSALRPDLPPEELYELTVLGLVDLGGYERVALWLRPNGDPALELVAAAGIAPTGEAALRDSPLSRATVGELRDAAESFGEAVWWRHSAKMPWGGCDALADGLPGGHCLLLPLVYTDIIGVVVCSGSAPQPERAHVAFVSRCADQVAVALTAASMVAENARTTAELRQVLENQQALLATIAELSTPVLPLLPGVLLLPLVSSVDELRMGRITDALLHEVSRRSAKVVLLDVTGVPVVDTRVAGELLRLARAVRLLGATVIIVGIRPEIAQTMVSLGLDLSELMPRATLAEGLVVAIGMVGQRLVGRTGRRDKP